MERAFNHLAIFVLIILLFNIYYHGVADDRKVYIAYMGSLPKDDIYSPLEHHHSILEEVLESSLPSDCLVRSYRRSFNGFAAKLTEKEKQRLQGMEGIVSVFLSETYVLHTTRSWDFIGLKENVDRVPEVESNVIVGMLDTGVWPEAESFSDRGFGPPPLKWKGACKGGKNFTCNNKLIGARFYSRMPMHISARDTVGHGTHTASIAAGVQVNNVSFYGLGRGNARGAVPSARIAVYTVCWRDFGCSGDAILAAFDDAISDGVDIISASLGSRYAINYAHDSIAIGSFHAMQRGILTSQSAGNTGPRQSSVGSVAPWILTVAASSTDRSIMSKVVLGDNTTLVGRAVNSFDMAKKIPLIYRGSLYDGISNSNSCNKQNSRWCDENRLHNNSYKGKIVFYNTFTRGKPALDKKASGMIVQSSDFQDFSWNYPLPASLLSIPDGKRVESYINNTKHPVANILKSEDLDNPGAPVVVSFSSRGPNSITREILKPDITAPGVEIVAAWPPAYPPSDFLEDKRSAMYNILSGTSMSCPHVTGAAAYVKAFHPDWSPSAIKSALMTTALALNSTENQEAEYSYGAGQIDPVKAVNPGLVYDAADGDYIQFLCSIGYTEKQMKLISGGEGSCHKNFGGSPNELNYPSMVSVTSEANFSRTVMNVGEANSTYEATVISPSNINISITPNVLAFESLDEKQSFSVKITATALEENQVYSASLVWSDGTHIVRSPIVVQLTSNGTRGRSTTHD